MSIRSFVILGATLVFGLAGSLARPAPLPPVPVPTENPITEAKRVLGKVLFWDEQLSSDNTVACGTCHVPSSGGADPRFGRNTGTDAGTIDDVWGSPGIALLDADGNAAEHPMFGYEAQIGRRIAPSSFGALWAEVVFWDGRAGPELLDPLTGETVIRAGGALESQALAPLMDSAEMAKQGRTWAELTGKLERERPLALAADLPADVAAAIAAHGDYPALFASAFGDPGITPVRIAFAIATYQRTLLADQTPWDRYMAGEESAMAREAQLGWETFQAWSCVQCHEPPLFTSNEFFNIALRRHEYDHGREEVTGDPEHRGDFKVPSLRNVGLRTRFMHTGEFGSVAETVALYDSPPALPGRDALPDGRRYHFNLTTYEQYDLQSFLVAGLTDPRVANEEFPFDRPTLRSERGEGDVVPPETPAGFSAQAAPDGVRLRWAAPGEATGVLDYVLRRDGRVIAVTTATSFLDRQAAGATPRYSLVARDAAANASPAVTAAAAR